MKQDFLDGMGAKVGCLTGPWWSNDAAINLQKEEKLQEAFFRIEFASVERANFQIAASDYYQVWLNGRWIGNGPARASHGCLTVDTWDLPADALRKKNTLAIQVLWEGIFTFDHVRGTPGLWYAVVSNEKEVATEILVSEKTGRMPSSRSSHQRGWIEEIDGRQRATGWVSGPWNPSQWVKPVLHINDPAVRLEARDIRPFARHPVRAQNLSFVGSGDLKNRTKHRGMWWTTFPDFESTLDLPSIVMQEEALEPAQASDQNLSALVGAGFGVATLGPDARGLDRTLQFNFGKLLSGTIEFTVEAPAGTIIDFGWSEGRWNDAEMGVWARSAQPAGSAPSEEFNDARQGMRYICTGGGVETFHGLFLVSLHHLRVAFRSPEANASIRLHECRIFFRGYAIAEEGAFVCSDSNLNRIHDAAVYTMACSIDDVYMDCPGRERGGYTNDSYFASLGFLDMTGDVAFDRRFLRQFADSQDALKGAVAPCYPSDSTRWTGRGGGEYVITGHILFWLLQCERHLRLFGDEALKEKWKPSLTQALDALAFYRGAEGLLENIPWDTYFDWSRFDGGPIPTGDSFLYAHALIQLGRFYGNREWISKGEQTRDTVEKVSWRADQEFYSDTIIRKDDQLSPGSKVSGVINYVALWTQLTPPDRAKRVWRQLRVFRPLTVERPLFDYETNFVRPNLVGLMYRFDLQGRKGELAELIHDLREAYEPMFARGQMTLGEHLGYHGSLCHGYNAFVIYLLNRHIAGIELPGKPGEVIRIRPHPGVLGYCQARACWMGGHVQVWWSVNDEQVEILASVPPGQKGELVLKHGAPVAFTGSLHIKMPLSDF